MSVAPWEADRPLTLETARDVVRVAFPAADADSLKLLGSGWEFDVFVTGDGWVFRFPRRADVEGLFEREAPVLALVRTSLPPSVAVPLVRVLEHRHPKFPYRIAAHPFIEGIPADQVETALRPVLARSLAEALGALHSVPEAAARAAGLEEMNREERGRIEWFERGSSGALELRGQDDRLDEALAWLARVEDPLRRLDAPLRMIHQDLGPEHLLADDRTGHLIGILDWTDSVLGDPARDFMPLVVFGGWGFADEVLAHYPHAVDSDFWGRLRFMARLLPLMWLGHANLRGEDIDALAAQVADVFAG